VLLLLTACSSGDCTTSAYLTPPPPDANPVDAPADVSAEPTADATPDVETPSDADAGPPFDPDAPYPHFCDLPGSVVFTANGRMTVPDGTSEEACRTTAGMPPPPWWCFLHLPAGYCAHFFGNIASLARTGSFGGNVRQLRFAPNGDLFVASPTQGTTGGGVGGLAAVVVLPDDNRDGYADTLIRFVDNAPSTQGILFANGYFYFQATRPDDRLGTKIMRVAYQPGDRAMRGLPEQVLDTSTYYTSPLHWPKTLDQADDGSIYVAIGSDQDEGGSDAMLSTYCQGPRKLVGGIIKLDGTPNGTPVARGFRNPIAVRCQKGHNLCFASELAKDYSGDEGGREKLVPIRNGDDWGFPCCATRGLPHSHINPVPDCSGVTPEDVSFLIGHTPFGFDFERGKWPAPYTGSVFVPLHGSAGGWDGARVVAVATDPMTGRLKQGSTIDGGTSTGAMTDFATGWDNKAMRLQGRPAAIEFAADGRMFIGNDNNGDVIWIAPVDLPR
jgi:glucose/arabinose dehydrogenase